MRKILLLVISGILLTGSSLRADKTLVFSAPDDFPAILSVSEAIVREAYKRIDLQIVVNRFPGSRSLQMSNSGETDGELFRIAGISKKYSNLIMIPEPLCNFKGTVFSKNDNIIIDGWNSLKPYKIGIMRGIVFSDTPTAGMNREVCSELGQLFTLLDKNRVDAVIYTELDGRLFLSEHFATGRIKALKPQLVELPLYNYLHKKHEKVAAEITPVLKKMKEEGTIPEIIKQTELDLFGRKHSGSK